MPKRSEHQRPKFGGVIRTTPRARRKCAVCKGMSFRDHRIYDLTQRHVCKLCGERYLQIYRSAKLAGVKILPYEAPVKYRSTSALTYEFYIEKELSDVGIEGEDFEALQAHV